jgi:hypothetical protein
MDSLRNVRIAEISKYDLDYANESLAWAKHKLENLKNTYYEGNIPNDLFLDIHLTVDEIYFLEKRIGDLLDKQLDEYRSLNRTPWDKKEACKKLREATADIPEIRKLTDILYASLSKIPYNNRDYILENLAILLKDEGFICVDDCIKILQG